MQNTASSARLSPHTRVYIAGHRGMVGAAIVRQLLERGHDPENLILKSHKELDLCNQAAVQDFFHNERIDHVILAAAKVGGIHANNTYPAEFIYINTMIQANIIDAAYKAGVEDLLFLGSSCIYPKEAPQPMQEEHLLGGKLEPTNAPYAIAKIAGIMMCESYNRQYGTRYRSVMPTNLYGPGDNYHLENSHVIPAMIRKYHLARLAMEGNIEAILKDEAHYGAIPDDIKDAIGLDPTSSHLTSDSSAAKVILWGTGKAYREFLHVDDMASACLFAMDLAQSHFMGPNPSFLNVGTGRDQSIAETALQISETTGFSGETIYDTHKPDGTGKKLLDTSRINTLGWRPRFSLAAGIKDAYEWYLRSGDDHEASGACAV